ncbi:MAG TPA: signal peptidase I [Halothiobacillaceae bacterium]|nr:signal peptidase I [Halothiobacillaceae bacterium]
MDFTLILVLATFVSGIIWAVDFFFLRAKRRAKAWAEVTDPNLLDKETRKAIDKGRLNEPLLIDYARSFFPVLLVVLVIRSFLFEPFRIPSGSMMPTLQVGDFILVNKFTYGLRLPVTNHKILPLGKPERGDVAVFKYPRNPKIDYIKRIIGLPGDHIRVDGHQIWVNDELIKYEIEGEYRGDNALRNIGSQLANEQLGDRDYQILLSNPVTPPRSEWTVPDDAYFVIGDNRDHSNDSRFWGFVPEANLVGKAVLIWMHWDWGEGGFDGSRAGTVIK